jgi:hypothetical protein
LWPSLVSTATFKVQKIVKQVSVKTRPAGPRAQSDLNSRCGVCRPITLLRTGPIHGQNLVLIDKTGPPLE